MTRHVEWIGPRRRVQWLGQDPIAYSQMLPQEGELPTNGEQPPTNGEQAPPPTPEEEEKQIQKVERGLSTTEKVVIASLFLQVLTFAWGVYSFQTRQNMKEAEA